MGLRIHQRFRERQAGGRAGKDGVRGAGKPGARARKGEVTENKPRAEPGLRELAAPRRVKNNGGANTTPPKEAHSTEKCLKVKLQSLREHALQVTVFTSTQTLSGQIR